MRDVPDVKVTGAILLYRIPHVVVGENRTFMGEEEWRAWVEVVQDETCIRMTNDFIARQPELWNDTLAGIGGEGVVLEMKHEGES